MIIPSLDFFLSLPLDPRVFHFTPVDRISPRPGSTGFEKSVLDREKRRVRRISMSLRTEEPRTGCARTKRDGYVVVRYSGGAGGVNKPEGRHRINRACLKSSVKFRRFRPPLPPRFLAFLARALILRFNGMQSSTWNEWRAIPRMERGHQKEKGRVQRNEI